MVKFPPFANARTASSLLRTTTNSDRSAPAWRPNPTPPVPMHEGADQDPSGKRAMTTPDPTLALQTKPALTTVKMARPVASGGKRMRTKLIVRVAIIACGRGRNDACKGDACLMRGMMVEAAGRGQIDERAVRYGGQGKMDLRGLTLGQRGQRGCGRS